MKYLLLFLFCLISTVSFGADKVGVLLYVVGDVSITTMTKFGKVKEPASNGVIVTEGAIISTGRHGKATLMFRDKDTIRIFGGTRLMVSSAWIESMEYHKSIYLYAGSVNAISLNNSVINTPTGRFEVKR